MGDEKTNDLHSYVDSQIKKLKEENNANLGQLAKILIATQRIVADMKIGMDVKTFADVIDSLPDRSHLKIQLLADATRAKKQSAGAGEPFKFAVEFHQTWSKRLQEEGAKIVVF